MIKNIVQTGEPVEHRGIVMTPLFPRRDPAVAYVTLDEALAGGLHITEVDESGSVPELVVENPLDARVLLYDGEELLGAKQNRILNVSVLVEAKSSLRIPVSCVEQGRWRHTSASFSAAPHISHAELRRRKAEAQAARPLVRGIAQGEVWDEVRMLADRMSVDSSTDAVSDIHRAYAKDTRALEGVFPAQPGQCGVILGLGPSICIDLVSQPDAFSVLWPKIRAGYLLDALEHLDGKPVSPAAIPMIFYATEKAEWSRQPSAGLGEDVRLRGERVLGSGLELEGEAIQLSVFMGSEGRNRDAFGRIARPTRRR